MYTPEEVAERIKLTAKMRKISVRTLLKDCNLGPNTITGISQGRIPKTDTIAKIADYLDCSVDYLLGRDEESPRDEYSEALNEAINLFSNLSEDGQKQALSYLEFLQKK